MQQDVTIIFPHQLFEQHPALHKNRDVILIEEWLFFNQFRFHKQKIAFHRNTMLHYADHLKKEGYKVQYIEGTDKQSDIRICIQQLNASYRNIHIADPVDDWLTRRIREACKKGGKSIKLYPTPMFMNDADELINHFKNRSFFQTNFYIHQRKKWNILLDGNQPAGGKWTFDSENRLKYPKGKTPPPISKRTASVYFDESVKYTKKNYNKNYGHIENSLYPHDFSSAVKWLNEFLKHRLAEFGPFEDAIVYNEGILHHSVLTPLLNCGLLTPEQVVEETLQYAEKHTVPLQSLEGFIRQIIGWREFMRALYITKGNVARTTNFWGFSRKMPSSFYSGETGIFPIDNVIKKVLKTGYCHHIERLMVTGNFMLLCEFDPNEVYKWNMTLFIDAYDWVMVPNVYSMSQFADGGIMATKPYISGSNYLMKMSDYPKGDWQEIWDALFWRFMDTHRKFFTANPRLGMLVKTFDKMNPDKKEKLLLTAATYLKSLD